MGRWSRRLASSFLEFITINDGDSVLDVGCGTGSLAYTVAATRPQSRIVGIDPSTPAVEYARERTRGGQMQFDVGDAQKLPYPDSSFDKTLALLVINLIPDARKTMQEMRRVTRPGGGVAAAVWDYGEGMTMFRTFWDTVVKLDSAAEPHHQRHVPYCRRGELSSLWRETGLVGVLETGLTIPLDFASFDDYFTPFLKVVGPSGSYLAGLPPERQTVLAQRLREDSWGRDLTSQSPCRPGHGLFREPFRNHRSAVSSKNRVLLSKSGHSRV